MVTTRELKYLSKNGRTVSLDKLFAKISVLQTKLKGNLAAAARCHVEIGMCLLRLKGTVGNGKQPEAYEKAGYKPRVAERLMQLAGSAVGKRIRLNESQFEAISSVDTQKLIPLCRLNDEQLDQALEQIKFDKMSREKIAEIARTISPPPRKKTKDGPGGAKAGKSTKERKSKAVGAADRGQGQPSQDPGEGQPGEGHPKLAGDTVGDNDHQEAQVDSSQNEDDDQAAGQGNRDTARACLVAICDSIDDELIDRVVEELNEGAVDAKDVAECDDAVTGCRKRLTRIVRIVYVDEAASELTAAGSL